MAVSLGMFIGCNAYGFLLCRLGTWRITLTGLILAAFSLVAVRCNDHFTLCRYYRISFTCCMWNINPLDSKGNYTV